MKKTVYHPAMNLQKDENDKFKEINTIKKKDEYFCYVCGFLLNVTIVLICEERTSIVLSVSAHVARIIRLFKTFKKVQTLTFISESVYIWFPIGSQTTW